MQHWKCRCLNSCLMSLAMAYRQRLTKHASLPNLTSTPYVCVPRSVYNPAGGPAIAVRALSPAQAPVDGLPCFVSQVRVTGSKLYYAHSMVLGWHGFIAFHCHLLPNLCLQILKCL